MHDGHLLIKRRSDIKFTKCRTNYAVADLTTAVIHDDKYSSDVGKSMEEKACSESMSMFGSNVFDTEIKILRMSRQSRKRQKTSSRHKH